ncbi:MAG: FecR family protein, partial [bacterium]
MKRLFFILTLLTSTCFLLHAGSLNKAEVTVVVNDVRLAEPSLGERKAKVQDVVQGKASLNTGVQSRAEMMFDDKTLARIGANTSFSFEQGTRNMDLKYGTMLLQVPKDAGGATIRTAAVTAAITGTTILIEYNPGHHTKVIVLEGTLRLYLKNQLGESVLIQPGQMILLDPNATVLPEPVDVDIKRLVLTSRLIQGVAEDGGENDGGAGNLDLDLVDRQILSQEDQKREGDLTETNLLILGEGRDTVIANDELLAAVEQAVENNPNNGLGKYGPLNLIQGTYTINNTTTIVTDPTITTGGVTDRGSMYNPAIQGSTSRYLFGNTSSFDKAIDFDITNNTWGDLACFNFGQLIIQGVPTLNTGNGGAHSLGFCSETSISTAGSPFSWDLNGIRLGIVTEDGNITLNGGSLSSLLLGGGEFYTYARGAGRNLSISSLINAEGGDVNVNAEQDISITSFIQNADRFEAAAGRNFSHSVIQAREFDIKAGLVFPSTVVVDSNLQFRGVGHSIFVESTGIQLNGTLDYTTTVRSEFNAGSLGLTTSGAITGANKFIATGALTANG